MIRRAVFARATASLRLVLAVVLGMTVFAAPASAQTRAALVRNVDEPALAPLSYTIRVSNTFSIADLPFSLGTVPAGKRLVIDHVSYFSAGSPVATMNSFSFFTGLTDRLYVPINPPHGNGIYDGSFPVTAYFEPGESVSGLVQLGSATQSRSVRIVIAAHYVTL